MGDSDSHASAGAQDVPRQRRRDANDPCRSPCRSSFRRNPDHRRIRHMRHPRAGGVHAAAPHVRRRTHHPRRRRADRLDRVRRQDDGRQHVWPGFAKVRQVFGRRRTELRRGRRTAQRAANGQKARAVRPFGGWRARFACRIHGTLRGSRALSVETSRLARRTREGKAVHPRVLRRSLAKLPGRRPARPHRRARRRRLPPRLAGARVLPTRCRSPVA